MPIILSQETLSRWKTEAEEYIDDYMKAHINANSAAFSFAERIKTLVTEMELWRKDNDRLREERDDFKLGASVEAAEVNELLKEVANLKEQIARLKDTEGVAYLVAAEMLKEDD